MYDIGLNGPTLVVCPKPSSTVAKSGPRRCYGLILGKDDIVWRSDSCKQGEVQRNFMQFIYVYLDWLGPLGMAS